MERTIPVARVTVPMRALAAVVIAGEDAGARAETQGDPLAIGSAEGNALRLRDRAVSRYHLELTPEPSGVRVRDLGSTNGTRVGALRVIDAIVPAGSTLSIGDTSIRILDAGATQEEVEPVPGLVGQSGPARLLARRVRRAGRTSASVLLEGESGTGKERVAEALHTLGDRASSPFVVVDCASLAPGLVASELFGHARGAFTGAREAREGAFVRADGGTLFLDEIGELPADVQPLLLGALARGVVRPLGSERDHALDVRVIAATHRDLRASVNRGTFRADLYFRLAVLRIPVPSLRERSDDVPALVEHFLAAEGWDGARSEIVPDDVLARWCEHAWPGNVRELRNAVQAALALREPPELEEPLAQGPFAEVLGAPFREARDTTLERFERRYLGSLLEQTRQNVAEAARVAGVDRTHLHDLLKRHGLR